MIDIIYYFYLKVLKGLSIKHATEVMIVISKLFNNL